MLRLRDFMTGVVIGGLAGAGIMLLFAPRSGKRMRAKLQHQVEELREQLAEELEDTEEEVLAQAHRIAAGARGTAEEMRRRGQEMLDR